MRRAARGFSRCALRAGMAALPTLRRLEGLTLVHPAQSRATRLNIPDWIEPHLEAAFGEILRDGEIVGTRREFALLKRTLQDVRREEGDDGGEHQHRDERRGALSAKRVWRAA